MAKAWTSAQHYLECDNCEENPAQFICKTCAGHLCTPCKSEHEKKKITRNHEILSLTSKNEEMVDLLYCPKHAKKKLECYCHRCREPVCTSCRKQYHKGHTVESLTTVYKKTKQRKEQIENVLLPRHKELLAKEKEKKSAFRKKADEIQEKIDAHTQSMIKMVKHIGQQTIVSLRQAEQEGLLEMDAFNDKLQEKIEKLQFMSKQIPSNLEAKLGVSFFKSIHDNDHLERFQTLPSSEEYTFTDFEPKNIKKEDMIGKTPVLHKNGSNQRGMDIPLELYNLAIEKGLIPLHNGKVIENFDFDEEDDEILEHEYPYRNRRWSFNKSFDTFDFDEEDDEIFEHESPYQNRRRRGTFLLDLVPAKSELTREKGHTTIKEREYIDPFNTIGQMHEDINFRQKRLLI